MSGILNNKERILDLVVTQEGRRQISSGKMVINFASFSDYATFYQKSGSLNYAEDASNRIFFESNTSYQDVIVPEIPVGNEIRPFKTKDFILPGNGKVASGTFNLGFRDIPNVLTGGMLGEISDKFFSSITDNFNDLRILGTNDQFSDSNNFELLENTGSFSITSDDDFNKIKSNFGSINAEDAPSLFADKYFSHLPNFQYLPPVNTLSANEDSPRPLGEYFKLQEERINTYLDLQKILENKQKIEIKFYDTSRFNNVCLQIFECFDDGSGINIEKLSTIDFGEFSYFETKDNNKNVYFIGKIIRDGDGSDTYFNIFTIVAE